MKKLFALAAIFALVLMACGDGSEGNNTGQNNSGNTGTTTNTTLTIYNNSSYELVSVDYASIEFGTINSGRDNTKDVSPGPRFIFFTLRTANGDVRCRTVELVTCDEGEKNGKNIMDTTIIMVTGNERQGTLGDIFNELNKSKPSAPTGVTTTALSTTSTNISWNPAPNATSYKVYYATSTSGDKILIEEVTETSYTHTGLQSGTTYYYYITAVNDVGESGYSSYSSETSKSGAPTGVTTAAQSATSIRISWNPVAGATSYKVYYATGSASGTKILASTVTGNTTTSYTHTGLSAGNTYYYYIVAVNSGGESDYSSYASGVVLPATPTGVTAAAQSTSSIRISWNSVSGATSYKVYYTINSSSDTKISATTVTGNTTTSYTHSGLSAGNTYYYYIVAVNSGGESGYSSYVYAVLSPAAPTGVQATADDWYYSSFSILLNQIRWNPVSGANSYEVYYSEGSSTGTKILLDTTYNTSYPHSPLKSSTYYYYWVVAVNNGGKSAYSSYASIRTK